MTGKKRHVKAGIFLSRGRCLQISESIELYIEIVSREEMEQINGRKGLHLDRRSQMAINRHL